MRCILTCNFICFVRFVPGLVTSLQHTQGFGDLEGGIRYKDGIITIPKYGFYHIYSQIFFQHDERELDPMLVHYVYLFRREEKWIIMQSYVSKPDHTREGQVSLFGLAGDIFIPVYFML